MSDKITLKKKKNNLTDKFCMSKNNRLYFVTDSMIFNIFSIIDHIVLLKIICLLNSVLSLTCFIFHLDTSITWWLRQQRICLQCRVHPWVGTIPWRREWQPTPVFLPGKFHGQKSLAGYSPWVCKESDMTELLTPSLSFLPLPCFLFFY